ncbi:hypothetical protein [Rahnella sp. PCH160]|uniref:hypothetical protein n=1 Tax=Rahnella sp. PCH160 TaxID=3447928 RepID=UPI0039FC79A6
MGREELNFCKDSNIDQVLNYKSITFGEGHSDGGYAIRAIEIKRFNKIKLLCEKFKELTGYEVPYTECNASEMNLLVEHGVSVIYAANKAYKDALADAKSVDDDIAQAHKGKCSGFGGYESLRAYLQDLEYRKDRVDGHIASANKLLTERRELLGMLRQQAEILSACNVPGLMPVILTRIPTEYLTGCPIKETFFDKSASPIFFAWKELDALEAAIQRIVFLCTKPTNKYELNNGGEKKSHYYREYYSIQGSELRQRMTAIDYVSNKYQHDQSFSTKIRMMNSSI